MSTVRPFRPDDVPAVTRLYGQVFGAKRRNSRTLEDEIRSFYLDGPFRETDIPSLVHVNDAGQPTGFIGVHTVPYRIEGRQVRAAFCGALLSTEASRDPLAGARLLKAFLGGSQDLSLSETANPLSQGMWERLRGTVLAPYSMEWMRVLRPAGSLLALASLRLPPLRALARLGVVADRAAERRGSGRSTVLRFSPSPSSAAALSVVPVSRSEFALLVKQFGETRAAVPDWNGGYLEHVLDTGLDKPAFGDPVMGAVRSKGGEAVGAFLYHLRRNGIGRVLQILFKPGKAGVVLDHLFADAAAHGAVGLRGRTEPGILAAMPGRHMLCVAASSTVVHAREAALLTPFLTGDCVLNGLAGERWSRFFGTGL